MELVSYLENICRKQGPKAVMLAEELSMCIRNLGKLSHVHLPATLVNPVYILITLIAGFPMLNIT